MTSQSKVSDSSLRILRSPSIWIPALTLISIIGAFIVDFLKDAFIGPLSIEERIIIVLVLLALLIGYTLIATVMGYRVIHQKIHDDTEHQHDLLKNTLKKDLTVPVVQQIETFGNKLEDIENYINKNIGVRVKYEEEIFKRDDPLFQGRVYRRLTDEIASAQTSIRVLAIATLGQEDTGQFFSEKVRQEYLKSLNTLITKHLNNDSGFTYHRLYQRSPDAFKEDDKKIDPLAREHVDFLINHMQNVSEKIRKSCDIEIGVIPTSRNTGFMLIDQRKLILMVSGVDENKTPYMHALLIFENDHGEADELITTFENRFEDLMSIYRNNDGKGQLYSCKSA